MLKKLLPNSEFSRNVITLVTGTAIAQAIPIAISPILTRIYTPEDFGVFALYLSITSVIAVAAAGRYEFAITLPPKDEDAVQILWLSCLITFIVSLIILSVVVLFNSEITALLGNERISIWLYFIPVTVFLSGIYQSYNYWFNRKKQYGKLSKSRVVQTVSSGSVNLGLGYVFKGGALGLVVGNIFGQLLSALYFIFLFIRNPRQINTQPSKVKMIALAKRYRDFPKFDVLASFFNVGSNQVTHIFFNSFFTAVISGYFYLTQKIIQAPVTLIAGAIQDVFKMEVVNLHIAKGNTRRLFLRTLKKLALLAIFPTLIIFFFAEDIFTFVFGSDWAVAGEYARIFTPVFFMRFLSFPLSYMFYVREKQKYNIIGQFLLFISIISTFLIGKNYSAETTVILLSLVYSLYYLAYLYISYNLTSKGKII
jgi:O-antigen/teichoic acid export membrane protein